MKFKNTEPTRVEKLMFRYYGLYAVESNESIVKYVPIHTEQNNKKDFPYILENIDDAMIEWDDSITFNKMSETVSFQSSFYDIDAIVLIQKRMEELGFKKTFTTEN